MTSPEKLNALILAIRHVVKHKIPGDIVECGVWRGGSMQATAAHPARSGDTSRDLYLFDTFEGMPPPTEEDLRHDGKSAADLLAAKRKDRPVSGPSPRSRTCRTACRRCAYPAGPDPLRARAWSRTPCPSRPPSRSRSCASTPTGTPPPSTSSSTLYPRLVSGGVLLIDDYGWWQGSRKAVDEYLEQTGERLLLLRMDEGRIAVKP